MDMVELTLFTVDVDTIIRCILKWIVELLLLNMIFYLYLRVVGVEMVELLLLKNDVGTDFGGGGGAAPG